MTTKPQPKAAALDPNTRRRFLLQTLGLAAAGLAAGGGAAWAKNRLAEGAAATAVAQALEAQLADVASKNAALSLSVSTLQTQLAELQNQMSAANGQNAQLATALSTAQKESAGLKSQLTAAQTELAAANDRVARYQALTRLYEILESTGLDAAAQSGIAAVGGGLTGVLGLVPLLNEGLDQAQDLLAKFEQTLPEFAAAMAWLGEQVVNLKVGLYALELAAQRAVQSAAAGAAAVFAGFAQFILRHLPFGIGENVRSTLAATQDLIRRLAGMTETVEDQVLLKISKHVADGPHHWKRTLITPLRDNTLSPAEQLLTRLDETGDLFTAALKNPVSTALEERAAVRDQIAAYRSAHNL